MGKQTHFYISSDTRNEFLEYVFSKRYRIFSEKYDICKGIEQMEHFDCSTINDWCLIFYKDIYGDLIYNENQYRRIDKLYSPVVEFIDTIIHEEDNYISNGRIWISNINVLISENARESFLSDYNELVKWIRKNIPRREFFDGTKISKGYVDEEVKGMYEYKYSFV